MAVAVTGECVELVSFDSYDPERAKILVGGDALWHVRHLSRPAGGIDEVWAASPLHLAGAFEDDHGGKCHVFFEIVKKTAMSEVSVTSGAASLEKRGKMMVPGEGNDRQSTEAAVLARAALTGLQIQMALMTQAILAPDALDYDGVGS